MKANLLLIALVVWLAFAVATQAQVPITQSNSGVISGTQCVNVPAAGLSTGSYSLSGSWSGTVTAYGVVGQGSPVSLQSQTANGSYTVPVSGYTLFQVCGNSISSGMAYVQAYTAISGGGSGGSAGTTGLPDGNSGFPVTTTPYSVQCDSGSTLIDRVAVLRLQSGASAVTAPDHTATGCGKNFTFALIDDGAGAVTVNRGGTDTFTITDGSTNTDGATSFTLTNGQYATLNNGVAGIWEVRLAGGSVPVPIPTPGVAISLGPAPNGVCIISGGNGSCTLPTPATGDRYCARNADNQANIITLNSIPSTFYELPSRAGYTTVGHELVSGGVITDQICVLGLDSTHYLIDPTSSTVGTWTDTAPPPTISIPRSLQANTATSSLTVTVTMTNDASNLIVATVKYTTSTSLSSMTDGSGHSLTCGSQFTDSNGDFGNTCYLLSSFLGSHSYTATFALSVAGAAMSVAEFHASSGSWTSIGTPAGAGAHSSTSLSTGTVTPTTTGTDLAVCTSYISNGASTLSSPLIGAATPSEVTGSPFFTYDHTYYITFAGDTTARGCTGTYGPATDWIGTLNMFKAL